MLISDFNLYKSRPILIELCLLPLRMTDNSTEGAWLIFLQFRVVTLYRCLTSLPAYFVRIGMSIRPYVSIVWGMSIRPCDPVTL